MTDYQMVIITVIGVILLVLLLPLLFLVFIVIVDKILNPIWEWYMSKFEKIFERFEE